MTSFNPLVGINESTLSNFNNVDNITESDEDYVSQAFNFLIEFNTEYNDINKLFYKGILESDGNITCVQETYADFFSSIKKMIDKFLAFIKSIFDKFIEKLHSFVQSEKYLIQNKSKFSKFTNDDDFTTDGFNYTFNSDIPLIDLTIKFDSALLGDISKIDKASISDKETNKAKAAVDKMHNDLRVKLESDYYDIFRGTVIGNRGSIPESDFTNECFKIYRSGALEPEEVNVNKGYIESALERINRYKTTIQNIEETKNRIFKEYSGIRDKIDKMIKPNKTESSPNYRNISLIGFDNNSSLTDVAVSYDTLSSIDSYLKTISNQVQEMSNIHSIAFSTKMEAVKEEYRQDKRILYQALSKCSSNQINESSDSVEVEGSLWII